MIDKQTKKGELCKKAGIHINSMGKLAKGQNLTVDNLARICVALDCKFDDIMEILPDNKSNRN
jgi:DNA-binding Xre family transcriptional regulator